ncbi:MAG: type II secretion system protein M [Thiohalomonadaceae bacterium]|jgi:general secretion pathway protein M
MKKKLQHHWMSLQDRDRHILLGGGVVVLLLLFYTMLWEPLNTHLRQLEQHLQEQQANLVWMQQAAKEVQTLRGATPTLTKNTQSLLTISDNSSREHNLDKAIKRIQPDGQHTVRIWLEEADFNSILRWLDSLLMQHQVHITMLNIEGNAASPGQVNARLTLESTP